MKNSYCLRLRIDGLSDMSLADEFRIFVYENYVKVTRERGEATLRIRAGDVHQAMNLKGKFPTVCGALGSKVFCERHGLTLLNGEGPSCGANAYYTYKL